MRTPEAVSEIIELDQYAPYFLGTIANRWTAASSRRYLREFGVGIAEWRVLASLRSLGQASSLDAANLTGMDPAAVTRALTQLQEKGWAEPVAGRFIGRTKPFALTEKGVALYAEMRRVALEREAVLLQDLTEDDRKELLRLLRLLHARLPEL
jgi:DNA-binding MarR family transcriptional regulator